MSPHEAKSRFLLADAAIKDVETAMVMPPRRPVQGELGHLAADSAVPSLHTPAHLTDVESTLV